MCSTTVKIAALYNINNNIILGIYYAVIIMHIRVLKKYRSPTYQTPRTY